MKKLLGITLLLLPVLGFADVSGDVAFTTNYLSEGVSSSQDKPAPQANLTFGLPKSFYVNFWASTVDFDSLDGATAHEEFELQLGNTKQVTSDLSYDTFIGRYEYPGATDTNYTEARVAGTYKYFTGIINVSPDLDGSDTFGGYAEIDTYFPLFKLSPIQFNGESRLGHYYMHEQVGESYDYYYIGIDAVYKKIDLLMQYSDTFDDPTRREAVDHNHWLATLTYSFGKG